MISVIVCNLSGCQKNKVDDEPEITEPASYYDVSETLRGDLMWPAFYIENVTASTEEKVVSTAVYIVNNPGIAGALLRFYFDDRLTLIDAQPGKAFSSLDYTPPGKYTNPCNFSWDSESGMTTDNGAILVLTFELPEDLHSGEHFDIRCSFRDSDVFDENLNNVSIEAEIGTISIK